MNAYLQLFLMLAGNCQDFLDVFRETQFSKCFVDVVWCYGLLGFLFCYFVGFRGYEGDKFDATVNEKIARIACESNTRGREYLGYDLLNGGYRFCVSVRVQSRE